MPRRRWLVLRMGKPPAIKPFTVNWKLPGSQGGRSGERERERKRNTPQVRQTQDHCLQVVAMEDVHGFSIAMFDSA